MFIQTLQSDPVHYVTIVTTLIFSIVLHELAHGWAALWQGDDTPRRLGHMTPNPIVHMGPFGLGAVLLIGIGWGAMPVDPSRFRSRHGDALVSAAGPAMNVLLALISLTAFGLWLRFADGSLSPGQENIQGALYIFGWFNLLLAMFNLLPAPPLDGSSIAASFSRSYADWRNRHLDIQQFIFIGIFVVFSMLERTPYGLSKIAHRAADWYVTLVRG